MPTDKRVAVNTDHGLFVPVVRNAHHKGLRAINSDVKALAQKARDRTLTPLEMDGGTFTISNLGAFGVTSFRWVGVPDSSIALTAACFLRVRGRSAVINPPQAGILAVAATQYRLVPSDDAKALTPYVKVLHACVCVCGGMRFVCVLCALCAGSSRSHTNSVRL